MNDTQERLANMKKETTSPSVECESCHQEFNWWDLLWDLEGEREVCVNCYHAPNSNRLDKVENFQSGDIFYGRKCL